MNLLAKAYSKFKAQIKKRDLVAYWKQRANHFGERAVLDIRLDENQIKETTNRQKEEIFPVIKPYLTGHEKLALDFGCGTGRFTKGIAELIKGTAIGIDPIDDFIQIAKRDDPSGNYEAFENNKIPLEDDSVDLFWCCLVLGGIRKSNLKKLYREFDRIIKVGGLIVLVENTSDLPDKPHWFYRKPEEYARFLAKFNLKIAGGYEELGETISIMIGRKKG